jgi:hypothetical protein
MLQPPLVFLCQRQKGRLIVRICRNGLLCFFLLINQTNKAKSDSPYFTELGRNAIVQQAQDLKNSSVILVIAFAPGFEDLPTIAYYRIGRGSSVAVAYITNGEYLPSIGNDDSFYQLAGKRKEEAYQATSSVGAESYFLNIPVAEVSAGQSTLPLPPELEALLRAKIDTVLELVKPDVVVLQRDPFSFNDDTPRFAFLKNTITKILTHHSTSSQWMIGRIFIQSRPGRRTLHVPVDQKNSLWTKSYMVIGEEARENYGSLKPLLPLLEKFESHDYQLFFPSVSKQLGAMDSGLPVLGHELQSVYSALQQAVSFGNDFDREKILDDVTIVIGQIDALISRSERSLNRSDLRVLSEWKLGLERLRCSVLGINIRTAVSDSVVTPVQLFFFRMEMDTALFSHGEARILFPGVVEKKWIADEKQNTFYPLGKTNEFRIVTPHSIPYTSPETAEGFRALQVRAPFTFMIVHHDSDPAQNFMYRKEIPLTIAPPRSVEVLTPNVVAHRDSILCVRFRNNTRDPIAGVIYLDDPFVSSPHRTVKLPSKNYVLIDTVSLHWKDTTFSGIRETSLQAGPAVQFGKFYYHSLDVKTELREKIGLYSIADHPILQTAFLRLGVFPDKCDTTADLPGKLFSLSTLVIDELSLGSFVGSQYRDSILQQWLKAGGQMIVFPQYGFSDRSVTFGFLPIINAAEAMAIDTTDELFQFPNHINEDDFQGTSVPLSFGGLKFSDGKSAHVLLRSKRGNEPLLAVEPVGKGKIIYVALNMDAQFLAVQKWAYKLLSNLLSYPMEMN